MNTYMCPHCGEVQSIYNIFCENCYYSTVFQRKLDTQEQQVLTDTLKAIEQPFLVTANSVSGFHKLYKKPLAIMTILDETPQDNIETSLEEFEKNYPQLLERKRNAELLLVGTMMEEADDENANALCRMSFQLQLNKEKQLCLLCTAMAFHITPIEQVEELSEEKFNEIYIQVEREYKNHRFRQNNCYSMIIYDMVMRLVKTINLESLNMDIIRLVGLLYGIEEENFKYLSYYGDPEFTSVEEYLLYHGVPAALCRQVERYLELLDEYAYYNFKMVDEVKDANDSQIIGTMEWKILKDAIKLSTLGLQGVVANIRDGGYLHDSYFVWFGDMDECPFSVSCLEIIRDEASREYDFYTEEAKKIAKKRCENMKKFVELFEMEAEAKDKIEE